MEPRAATDFTFAMDAMQNATGQDMTITQVRLVGADHASMEGAYLAPILNRSAIGVLRGWPPFENVSPAFNAKVALPTPLAAHGQANLVLHVRATTPATVQAVEVTYISRKETLRVQNSTTFLVRRTCD